MSLLLNLAASRVSAQDAGRPRLLDLGSQSCIPCRMMAPILEELRERLSDDLRVDFVDVNLRENVELARKFEVHLIPTQIFLDAAGKELWRHEGFISRYGILAKWRELGFTFASVDPEPALRRMQPSKKATGSGTGTCYMCDEVLDPAAMVVVKTAKGDVRLCGIHHYFVMYSCLTGDGDDVERRAQVMDAKSGELIPATGAFYLYALAESTGRPVLEAFADRESARGEGARTGGSVLGFAVLKAKELSYRCGFCDRACYPQDVAEVTVNGLHTWGCCSHCAMGVAARTKADIEVRERDPLTGETIVVRTLGGYVASIEPAGAVAWFGLTKAPTGEFASSGCFHQGFFAKRENLETWLAQRPFETGRMISIDQVLADKLALTPVQIAKACKIGECAPK